MRWISVLKRRLDKLDQICGQNSDKNNKHGCLYVLNLASELKISFSVPWKTFFALIFNPQKQNSSLLKLLVCYGLLLPLAGGRCGNFIDLRNFKIYFFLSFVQFRLDRRILHFFFLHVTQSKTAICITNMFIFFIELLLCFVMCLRANASSWYTFGLFPRRKWIYYTQGLLLDWFQLYWRHKRLKLEDYIERNCICNLPDKNIGRTR